MKNLAVCAQRLLASEDGPTAVEYAVMLALIVSAIVTPDATLFTMLLMAVPLMVLYELGILGAKLFGHRNPTGESDATENSPIPVGTAGQRIR